jgi:hypothetical protein
VEDAEAMVVAAVVASTVAVVAPTKGEDEAGTLVAITATPISAKAVREAAAVVKVVVTQEAPSRCAKFA